MIMIRSQDTRRRKKHYVYKSKESLEKNPDIIPNKDGEREYVFPATHFTAALLRVGLRLFCSGSIITRVVKRYDPHRLFM